MADIQNTEDYKQYKAAVANFIQSEGLTNYSTGTADLENGEDPETDSQDPWFSKLPCECCQCPFGGSREYLYGFDSSGDLRQYQICEDCVFFINYGHLDDATMELVDNSKKGGFRSVATLVDTLAKTARILDDDDKPNSDPKLQALVGDPNDTRFSTFTQFKPNPGSLQLPNPLSPIEGDDIFFAYMIPGATFRSHDGKEWNILSYNSNDDIEIENRWYPRVSPRVSLWDIRRSIQSWIEPVTQTVPPPPPGVDYSAQLVRMVDEDSSGRADENVGLGSNRTVSGW